MGQFSDLGDDFGAGNGAPGGWRNTPKGTKYACKRGHRFTKGSFKLDAEHRRVCLKCKKEDLEAQYAERKQLVTE
jgi:hypothetical protein